MTTARLVLQIIDKVGIRHDTELASPGVPPITLPEDAQIFLVVIVQSGFKGEIIRVLIADTTALILDQTIESTEENQFFTFAHPKFPNQGFKQSRFDMGYSVEVRAGAGGSISGFGTQLDLTGAGIRLFESGAPFSRSWTWMMYQPGKEPFTEKELDVYDKQTQNAVNNGTAPADLSQLPAQIAAATLQGLGLLAPIAPYLIAGGLVLAAVLIVPGLIRGAFSGRD